MADLNDLMLAAGVLDTPAWFAEIPVPHWPFPHQMEDLKCLSQNIRFGLFGDPGTGKTFPAQIHGVLMAALGNKVVYVMPPKLIRQFQGEFGEFFPGLDAHLTIDHLDIGAVQKAKRLERWDRDGWPDLLLLSYEVFRSLNARTTLRTVPRGQWKRPPEHWPDPATPVGYWTRDEEGERVAVAEEPPYTAQGDPIHFVKGEAKARNRNRMRLKEAGYNVFVCDEAHALCNPEAIAFKSLQQMDYELGDDIALYLMTGTPVPTHLENVYGLIRLLDRTAYRNKTQFERKHVLFDPNARFRKVIGYQGEEEIYTKLYRYARRVQKRDLPHLGLKDPLITATPLRLAGKHKALYDQVLRERFAVLGTTVLAPDNDSALRHLALQLITCPDQFDESGAVGQDNELTKWLDDTLASIGPAHHKVIVFAYYQRTVDFLAQRYAAWNPAVMNGSTAQGWKEVERFNTDPTSRLFIVNWQSGGAGLNLQIASHIVFYEVPTSPKDAKQAIARCDRSGQTEIVNVYFPRVLGTLLDRNFKRLLENERQNNTVVRDVHDLLHQQLGVGRRAA